MCKIEEKGLGAKNLKKLVSGRPEISSDPNHFKGSLRGSELVEKLSIRYLNHQLGLVIQLLWIEVPGVPSP